MECEGFDTPEEAITAFCEALKEYDFEKAVSTFAIESYCEHFDSAGMMQRLGAFQPTYNNGMAAPAENDQSSRLNAMLRLSTIITGISRPLQMIAYDNMAFFSENDTEKGFADAIRSHMPCPVQAFSYSELQSAVTAMQRYPDFSNTEISKPLSPLVLSAFNPAYLSVNNLNNIFKQAVIAGASGVTEMGVIMEDESNIYLVTMNIVKYGDKWYNSSLGGNIMNVLNVDAYRSGIVGGSKELIDEMDYQGFSTENLHALFDSSSKQYGPGLTDQELSEFSQFYEEAHADYILAMQSEAEANGLSYDPEAPWIEQVDVMKELAEKKGDKFYASEYVSVYALSYDEMKHYFAVEGLI